MSRIDIHHHMFPPAYLAYPPIRDELSYVPPVFDWTPEHSLRVMDEHDIRTAVLSLRSPGVSFGDIDKARELARAVNDYATELKIKHPGRFGLWATLPLPDVEGSLAEIERALDTLGSEGIGLFTSYGEQWLGDPAFEPVLAELNRRKAVVFVHPQPPYYFRHIVKNVPPSANEYLFDTTRAITSLLYNGSFARHRDIRFIFCHAGGALPAVAGRIGRIATRYYPEVRDALPPGGVNAEFAQLYFDCSTSVLPGSLGALLDFVPASQIVLGTDSPVVNAADTLGPLHQWGRFTAEEIRGIESLNMLRLLPQLAA